MEQYGVSLNEAMALCCIGGDTLTASVISENTGLSASHTSKVIRSIEEKELIVRNLGDKDKRQMHFTLSDKGRECLEALKANEIEIPEKIVIRHSNQSRKQPHEYAHEIQTGINQLQFPYLPFAQIAPLLPLVFPFLQFHIRNKQMEKRRVYLNNGFNSSGISLMCGKLFSRRIIRGIGMYCCFLSYGGF